MRAGALNRLITIEEPTAHDGAGKPTYTSRGTIWAGRDADDEYRLSLTADGSDHQTTLSLMVRGPSPAAGWRVTLEGTTYIVRETVPRVRRRGLGPHIIMRCREEGA